MKPTINIYSPDGTLLLTPIITKEAEVRQALMADDHVTLSWNDIQCDTLPAGTYIVLGGERYTLLEPYSPEQRSEAEWKYSPQFESRTAIWTKKPFFLYATDDDGTVTSREPDFSFTGSAADFARLVIKAVLHETGESWTAEVDSELDGHKSLTFSATDIAGALSQIADTFGTEWLAEKTSNILYLGKAMLPTNDSEEPPTLEVGVNIGVPSVHLARESYYNRFFVYGSTRNITKNYNGASINNTINKRLTLDPDKFPEGYIDSRTNESEPVLPTILTFNDIYPRSNLAVKEARPRAMYTMEDGSADRVQIGTDAEGHPIYDQYAIWYVQFESVSADGSREDFRLPNTDIYSKDNPDGVLISGKYISVHFGSGALAGREFELRYHTKAQTLTNSDGVPFLVKEGDFEIVYTKDNNLVIPSMVGAIPAQGDKAVLFNIRMPHQYVAGAYTELEQAALKAITELRSDNNNYECTSDPVAFHNSPILKNLKLGQTVLYKNGEHSVTTRIIAITRKLDIPSEQTITLGNKPIKGSKQTLREEVTNANRDISLMASFNALTQATINNYNHAQRAMLEGFERISKMWQLDEEGRIYTPYAAYSLKDVAAFGPSEGIGGGGGLSEEALGAYLAREGYATQVWVREYVAANAPSVDLSAYLAKTEAAALYQPKGSYAAAAHTHGQYLTAHQDISHLLAKTEAAALYQPKGNYAAAAHSHDAYISAIGTSGDKLTYTKGTTTTSLYVPFASRSGEVCVADAKASVDTSQSWQAYRTDLKARFFDVYDNGGPDSYGCVLEIAGRAGHWQPQLWFGGWVNGVLRHRNRDYNSGTWGPWHTLLDTANYAATLDTRYLTVGTAQEVAGAKTFLVNVTARHPATTGGSARGFVVSNLAGTEKVIFGSLCSADVQEYAYVGWGDNGWQQGNNLAVCSSFLRYKGHDILHAANYASMLDGRYVNAAGDKMDGDLAVRKMHLQGGNEFNCDDKLWIAYRSTPQGVNVCHADQPFTYGSAGHEVLHRGNYSNLVNALNQPLTIRCGNDAKLIFDNTDGERYTVLSFREAGAEYANIIANSEAFVFSGKPVTIGSSLTTPYMNGVLDMKMERNLFFKHSSSTTGIYFSAQSDGSLSIRAHSGYSYAKTIGTISYGGNFGIGTTSPQWPIDVHGGVRCDDWFHTTGNGGWYSQTHGGGMYMRNSTWVEAYNKPVKIAHRTAIGCSGFGVGLQLRDDNHTAVEVCGGNTTMGMGCHKDGRWYWWRGTTDPAATSDKKYVMNFDGTVFNFGDRDIAVRRVYLDSACTVWFQYNAAKGVIEASHTIVSRKDVAAFSA